MLNVSSIVLLVFLSMVSYALYLSSFTKFLPASPGASREDQERVSFESQNSLVLLFNLGL